MKKNNEDCCYEEMTKGIGGQSIESECWDEKPRNNYENARKSFYGPQGFDWSGFERRK